VRKAVSRHGKDAWMLKAAWSMKDTRPLLQSMHTPALPTHTTTHQPYHHTHTHTHTHTCASVSCLCFSPSCASMASTLPARSLTEASCVPRRGETFREVWPPRLEVTTDGRGRGEEAAAAMAWHYHHLAMFTLTQFQPSEGRHVHTPLRMPPPQASPRTHLGKELGLPLLKVACEVNHPCAGALKPGLLLGLLLLPGPQPLLALCQLRRKLAAHIHVITAHAYSTWIRWMGRLVRGVGTAAGWAWASM
jgi:hypothetical protein